MKKSPDFYYAKLRVSSGLCTAIMCTLVFANLSEAHPQSYPQDSKNQLDPQKVEAARPPSGGYRLAASDLINIRVFQEDELESTARVGKDGSIPFPLIGSIMVGGKTVPETAAALTVALREYLTHPQVAVRIMDYSKRRFTVLGQVNRPGTFDLPDENPLTLLEGIGMAGGYSRIANPSRVTVKRTNPTGGEQVFKLA